MISVTIYINGVPIVTRSAVNTMVTKKGKTKYRLDDHRELWHARGDGAIPLAIEMLKGVHQV